MSEIDKLLTIGEVARHAGVRTSTVRYWESSGLLEEPGRVGGKRRYEEDALREVSLIVTLKRAGFTLKETAVILSGISNSTPPSRLWRELAERKMAEIERTLREASAMKRLLERGLDCDCLTLEDCLGLIGGGR